MLPLNLAKFMAELSNERPIFHSEADFQHALAWHIHHEWPECSMRLEFKPPNLSERIYIDIWAAINETTAAIELKYKTRGLTVDVKGENFDLTDQSAQDQGRYDYLRDIQRLEQVATKNNVDAFAVFLTNDSAYWKEPLNRQTVDADFRIHHGRMLTGKLEWDPRASASTKSGREYPIIIKGSYILEWNKYSQFPAPFYGDFKYLLVKAKGKNVL